jgi:ABC-type branched-subunit amino acid transport system substrate-binding protein
MRLVFLIATLLIVSSAAADESKPIKIGYALDLTGKGAFMGVQSRAGAQLAAAELQQSGTKIELVFEDHRTDAKTAATIATKFLDFDQVDAVLCDLTPTSTAASPIVARKKRLFFYQSPAASIARDNPFAFRMFLDYEAGCRAIVEEWKKLGISRVGHLKLNAEFGELCLEGSSKVFPQQNVRAYNIGDELRSEVLRLKNEKIEALLQTGYEADYISRFRAAADLNLQVPAGMPEPLYTAAVKQVTPSLPEKSIVFGFKPLNLEFVARLKQAKLYTSDTALESAAIGYLQVQAAAAAIKVCGREASDCSVKAVEDWKPANETLSFDGWKDRKAQFQQRLKQFVGGDLTPLQ